ncbi:MAG: Ig-like domain-containing protein, partial [Patescibacteria group bacterium]
MSCSVSAGQRCWTDNDCFLISGDPADQCQGTFVDGTWKSAVYSAIYKHLKICSNDPSQTCIADADCGSGNTCDLVLFEQDSNYVLYLPYDIKDKDGRNLSRSLNSPVYCQYDDATNQRVYCRFSTGDQNDTTPPEVTTTEPIKDGTGYPDRNVDRDQSINVNFSETIDATTVVDTSNLPHPNLNNVFIQKIAAEGGVVQPGGDLDTDADAENKIDADKLVIQEKTAGFRLSLTPGLYFESWTWYRVTVQNVEDLCGNALTAPVSWEFKTNDTVAGINSVYPTGLNVCPDEHIFVIFSTSMFNNEVTFQVDGQQIVMPRASSWPFPPQPNYTMTIDDALPATFDGTLKITDYELGDPLALNPDKKFRIFELIPEEPLASNANHTVTVTTDKVIDTNGTFLSKTWTFRVTTADQCTCQPYITALRPSEGGISECLTIQGQCFDGTTNHTASPSAVHFDATLANVESWGTDASGNDYVVTTSPAGFALDARPQVTVDIHYDESAYGDMTSNGQTYWYKTTDVSNGPCLYSVTTQNNRCYPGTPAVLTGIRFGPTTQSTKNVTFGNPASPLAAAVNTWSDTIINSAVPATPNEISGDVIVENNIGLSNGVPFNICQPPPGVPIVTKYWPTCDSACVNAVAGATFSEAMDDSTMTAPNVKLEQCDNSDCDTFVVTGFTLNLSYDVPGKTLTITPSTNLEINTWYKVTLTDGIRSTENVSIGNPNEGNNFVWKFKTKNDASLCALASVDVIPATRTLKVTQSLNYTAYAYGSPDSCNPLGQMLNSQSYNWSWQSSNPLQASVSSNDTNANGLIDPQQSVSALAVTNNVEIQATAQGHSDHGDLTITEDPTYCVTNADCLVNELGENCPGSTCLNNRCTPVLNSFSPSDGAVGTWVAARGCWFGTYVLGSSKLLFFNNQEGIIPDTNICGTGTWTNNRILREVPGAAATGVITVNRDDGQTAVSSTDFTVNAVVRPGICALNPNVGREGITEVQVKGKNFGVSRGSSRVIFNNNINANYSPAIWEDNNIRVIVPANATTGDVKVTVNSIDSNGWFFQVLPSACTTLCTQDSDCFIVPNQGCDKDGCCSDRPTFTSYPANNATDVCLNTLMRVVFNQSMDQSTLNASNILLASLTSAGPPPVWTNIPLAGKITTDSKTATISLGVLLERNTQYRISLHPTNIKNSKGVSLGSLGTIVFTTADSSG